MESHDLSLQLVRDKLIDYILGGSREGMSRLVQGPGRELCKYTIVRCIYYSGSDTITGRWIMVSLTVYTLKPKAHRRLGVRSSSIFIWPKVTLRCLNVKHMPKRYPPEESRE